MYFSEVEITSDSSMNADYNSEKPMPYMSYADELFVPLLV
jgi:hypothetical protein